MHNVHGLVSQLKDQWKEYPYNTGNPCFNKDFIIHK